MSNLLSITGGGTATAATTDPASISGIGVTILPGAPLIAGVGIGGLAGVQIGSSGAPAASTSSLLTIDIDLLLGLTLAPASSGSGGTSITATGSGAGGVTTPLGGVMLGGGGAVGLGVGNTGQGASTPPTMGGGGDPTTGGGSPPAALPDAHTAFQNIFRTSAADVPANVSAQLDTLDQMVASGQITAKQAILQIAHAAAGSTAVAEVSYQFFSGLTPTSDGLTYLVHSNANPSDLNDSYYASFNTENRYTNFASNLGLHSDYSTAFASIFGPMTFDGAVRTAYDRIVGNAQAAAAGINPEAAISNIEARQPYFQQVAHERFGAENADLSVKLAAIGYILEEAVKANVGAYGVADQNFLYDLADGKAQFHVDLVATYGKGTPLDIV